MIILVSPAACLRARRPLWTTPSTTSQSPIRSKRLFFVFFCFLLFDLTLPDKVHEAVIHPGGGDAVEHLDVHKVEVLGAASVVQVKPDYVDMVKTTNDAMECC